MAHLDPSHLGTQVLLEWLLRCRSVDVPSSHDGSIELTFPWQYRLTAAVSVFLSTGFLLVGIILFRGDLARQAVLGGLFSLLWLATLWGAWDALCVQLRASAEGVAVSSLGRTKRVLAWSGIESVRYATFGNWYTFRGSDGPTIRISIYRNGLHSFARLAREPIRGSPVGQLPASFHKHAAA